jgi:hypothetical protein
LSIIRIIAADGHCLPNDGGFGSDNSDDAQG